MSEHQHEWKLPDGPMFVIDTYPPQYPYSCDCGAFTHDPETGDPCQTCAPEDYARRGPTITLKGGSFDGAVIARPGNRSINLRVDPSDKRVQKYDTYKQSEDDADVWVFYSNNWTQPFVRHESTFAALVRSRPDSGKETE